MAVELRGAEEKLAELTGYKLKVVERGGQKLSDLLTSSNPWRGIDCGRELCLLCESKEKTGKLKTQDCTRRSVVYEIWCQECQDKSEVQLKERLGVEEGKEYEEERKKIKVYISVFPFSFVFYLLPTMVQWSN